MSAFVCTSVTQTRALWPSSGCCRRQIDAAEDAPLAQRGVDLGDRSAGVREVDDELLEERGAERRRAHAGQLAEPLGGVAGPLARSPARVSASPSRPDQRQIGAGRDRPQVLGRAGVLLGIAALDVRGPVPDDLAEAVLALDRRRSEADQERRVFGHESLGVGGGDEPRQAAAVMHVDPERLDVAADDVGAVARRRLEHAERDRVDADDGQRPGLARDRRDLERLRLDRAQKAGHLEVDAGGVVRQSVADAADVERPVAASNGIVTSATHGWQ